MLLKIAYRYHGLDYLAADKHGNLYLLPHFRFRRTVYFKKIEPFENGNKKAINYHGSNISFRQLKQKAYLSEKLLKCIKLKSWTNYPAFVYINDSF